VIFGGSKEPEPTYRRYIENRFRRAFGLDGVPVRIRFRSRKRRSRDGR
jgi:GTP-binding protein